MNAPQVTNLETTRSNLWVSGLLGWVLAFAGSLLLYVIATLAGISLEIPDFGASAGAYLYGPGLKPVGVTDLILPTLGAVIAATLYFAALRRFFDERAERIFQVTAVVLLLISLGAPLTLPVSLGNRIFLALMHVASATAIIWALTLRRSG